MKKVIAISMVLCLLCSPVLASNNALVHNVTRVNKTLNNFGELDSIDLDNRNSTITIALKLGEMREAVNSGLSIDVTKNRRFLIYFKALNEFKNGINDAEHGLRDKNKQYFNKAHDHFTNGLKYINKLIKLIELE